jgi:hypothetical protein
MTEHLFRQIYPHPVKRMTLALIDGYCKGLTTQQSSVTDTTIKAYVLDLTK